MLFPELIPDDALTLSQVPEPKAHFVEIFAFALTIDGYARHGSLEACEAIAAAPRPDSLSDLRTSSFFAQRAWSHQGVTPTEECGADLRDLVRQIRACLSSKVGA